MGTIEVLPLLEIFSYHFSQFIKLYTFLYILDQPNYIGRGVISDVQLSCTETQFQKCSRSGKNGSKHPMLSISMAYNVISCKKIEGNTQKIKIADFTM